MTYRGHVKQGVIVLNPPAQLPEGTEVEVRPAEKRAADPASAGADVNDNDALVSGSVASARVVLPREDFSDWKK
jgi:hypothetical protein